MIVVVRKRFTCIFNNSCIPIHVVSVVFDFNIVRLQKHFEENYTIDTIHKIDLILSQQMLGSFIFYVDPDILRILGGN